MYSLNFLPLKDLNRPYLTDFFIENWSLLLTKAHVFAEAFSGHLSLSNYVFKDGVKKLNKVLTSDLRSDL